VTTIFVTGATGLTGSNVCDQLIERGDKVRALVRPTSDTAALAEMGVDLVEGDIKDAADVRRAAEGCEAAIHTAALLGAAQQDMTEFEAVNATGTTHVLDAAAALDMRRVVALSTGTFFDDTAPDISIEDAPVADQSSGDPYNQTKLAAFNEAHERAAAGQDVVTCHPGAIFGPAPVVSRAMAVTSFNRVLRGALRGKLPAYVRFPISWVLATDVAWGSIAALDAGVSGERYVLQGRREDVMSVAECCNRLCEMAGVDHRVRDLDPIADREQAAAFGPTMLAIAEKRADEQEGASRETPRTTTRLGYDPTSLDDGLAQFLAWLRELGQI
jgi:nucleoside-diphosphate-sugar epimerase